MDISGGSLSVGACALIGAGVVFLIGVIDALCALMHAIVKGGINEVRKCTVN